MWNPKHPLVLAMRGWDRIRNTKNCPHCDGTGNAPSTDGRTECGFCDRNAKEEM